MRYIKKRFDYCLAGTVACTAAAVLCVLTSSYLAAALLAAAAITLATATAMTWESAKAAKLIFENHILNVGVANVLQADGQSESSVNVVVSGFGILMDGKPYKFGTDGVKLTEASIDRESIALSFGGESKAYSVRLLHGVASKEEIDRLSQRLRYETGVNAAVSGW